MIPLSRVLFDDYQFKVVKLVVKLRILIIVCKKSRSHNLIKTFFKTIFLRFVLLKFFSENIRFKIF